LGVRRFATGNLPSGHGFADHCDRIPEPRQVDLATSLVLARRSYTLKTSNVQAKLAWATGYKVASPSNVSSPEACLARRGAERTWCIGYVSGAKTVLRPSGWPPAHR